MFTLSLPIIDEFLLSVVVLTVLIGSQKRYRTPGPSGDEFSRPDHIFDGLGPPGRRSAAKVSLRGENHPNPKSGQDLDPDKPGCTMSYYVNIFVHFFLDFGP